MKPRCTKCDREISSILDIGKDYIEDGEYIVICDNCYINTEIKRFLK